MCGSDDPKKGNGGTSVSAEERLAFGGAALGSTVSSRPTAEVLTAETSDLDASAESRDQVAYRALLAFTLVLFVRPQDTIGILDPLHLAEVFGTFGIVALA